MVHARLIREAESELGLYFEPSLAAFAAGEPWLGAPAAVIYMLAHLPVTAAVLGWVLIRRPAAWPLLCSTFVTAQAATVAANIAWPCAPPSRLGVPSASAEVWGSGTIESAYALQAPFAAVPSGHVVFALVAGGAIAWLAPARWQRCAGVLWPLLTTALILVTGNHFWLDALASAAVTALAFGVALLLRAAGRRRVPRHRRALPLPRTEGPAARAAEPARSAAPGSW